MPQSARGAVATRCARPLNPDPNPHPWLLAATKPSVFFVLGGPGSGKGTQCTRLQANHEFCHLSAGDLLRAEKKSGSKDAELINSYIAEGKIVPVRITVSLIKKAMDKEMQSGGCSRFLIDGFPRNQDNVDGWESVVGEAANVEKVLFFQCKDDNVLVERIIERGKTSGRVDDNREAIKKRLDTYYKSTTPIIRMYAEQPNMVIEVDASESRDRVYSVIKKQLDLWGPDYTFDEEQALLRVWKSADPSGSGSVVVEKVLKGLPEQETQNVPTEVTLAQFAELKCVKDNLAQLASECKA